MKQTKLQITSSSLSAGTCLAALTLIFSLFSKNFSVQQSKIPINYYEQGLIESSNGNIEKALQIWKEGYDNLSQPDFRMSQAFMRVVTEQGLNEYYKLASEMYYWGLSARQIPPAKEALLQELEYLEPIIGYRKAKRLKKRVKKSDASVYVYLKSFWKLKDLTPLTDYNERIIEHWERIAYAHKHFSKINEDNFDDRGNIYIKYGSPDITKDGVLLYNAGFVNSLLRVRVGASSGSLGASATTNTIKNVQQFNLDARIRQLHEEPFYEVWVYRDLKDNSRSTIFLFGKQGESSSYDLKKSVEDFIPNAAFSMTFHDNYINLINNSNIRRESDPTDIIQQDAGSQRGGEDSIGGISIPEVNVTPALILQIMYFRQLASLDQYFGRSYNRMMNRYLDVSTRIHTSLAREFENTNANDLLQLQTNAPEEQSVYEQEIHTISVDTYAYRFLDKQNNFYVKVFAVSSPSTAVLYDHLKNNRELGRGYWNNYRLEGGVLFYDEEDGLVNQEKSIMSQLEENRRGITLTSHFNIKPGTSADKIVIAQELYKRSGSGESSGEIGDQLPFETTLAGIGEKEVELPESLETDQLQMSDLLIGFHTEDGGNNGFVPFTIAHKHSIPEGKNLQLYYEVYNLTRDKSKTSKFTFTYTIKPRKKGLKLFGGDKDEVSITLNEATNADRYSNHLEIETSGLKRGNYQLDVEITDMNSGEKISQSQFFEIK